MNDLTKTCISLALLAYALNAHANLANNATVFLSGQPGSWVSGGIGGSTATWIHGIDGIFSGTTNYSQGISITYQSNDYWNFDFAAPSYDPITNTNTGQPLKVNFYDGATRWPFNSPTKPGLSISGAGRGDNQLSGWFNVLDVQYGTGGSITSFAVDFRQYDENLTQSGPSLYGSLRLNSSIPLTLIPVPEPATAALMVGGVFAICSIIKVRRQRVSVA
jgi:hypothetical protein